MGQIPENYLPPRELWPDYKIPEEFVMPENANLTDCLVDKHIRAGKANNRAILFGDKVVTYGELQEMSLRLANSLAELGVEKQDRISIRMVNCPEVLPGDSTEVWTGSEFTFSVTADSVGGPSTTPFDWVFMLVAENGSGVVELLNGTHDGVLTGLDGEMISASGTMTLGHDVPSGNYTCMLTIDSTDAVTEQDEPNNVLYGANFSIINLDEYWADDVDRDGIPNDDDDCPESGGDPCAY